MNIVLNFDILLVGIAVGSSLLLGFIFFFANTKNPINKLFLLFTLVTAFWSVLNFLTYRLTDVSIRLLTIRVVMFFAIYQSYFLYQLTRALTEKKYEFSWKHTSNATLITIIVSLLCLTPFVFQKIVSDANSFISQPIPGPGIILFALTSIGFVFYAVKTLRSAILVMPATEVKPYRFLTLGILFMFILIITFNFLSPTIFNETRFIPYSAFFTLPFVTLTAYAIVKHKLLNLKMVTTEFLVLFLAIAVLLETILSKDNFSLFLRFTIFILILSLGILLIKSVIKEVQQRELLEILTKQLEEANVKLQALDKARAEFITIASHQLRTPPATIKWYLSSVLDGDYGTLKPEQKDILEKTNRTNNSLISLVDDMLNVSRIERGKMEFLFEQVSLLDLAKITFEQLEPIAKDKGLKLTFKATPKTKFPKLMADKEKIRQVMNNLIDNALKYTKQGTVAVNISASGDEIKFSVTDTGKGIEEGEQTSIFEKYTRGKESIKQTAGLGLGLYVAKIIIGQHKGKIWAESPGVEKGSTFAFTVPIKNNLKETTLIDLAKNQG